jgi:prophage tail gpP-like protein
MRDTISFLVNGKPAERIISYSVDSDLWLAADAFSFKARDPDRELAAGMKVELWVNKGRELVGVIDRVESKKSKKGTTEVSVSGRDLMGLLCDHCITEYGADDDLSGYSIKRVSEYLMRDIPFVNIKDIVYEGRASRLAIPFETYTISPGQTVFDAIKSITRARGLHFWCREDGVFVFGKPIASGKPAYRFMFDTAGGDTNVLEASLATDITDAFSKIIVHCQSADSGAPEEGEGTTVVDTDIAAVSSLSVPGEFPFYKPKVITVNGDGKSPGYEAQRLVNLSKAKALQLSFLLPGHSQSGANYKTNRMARVDDYGHGVHGDFLVSGRTFTMSSKKEGPKTLVRVCRPGIIIDS